MREGGLWGSAEDGRAGGGRETNSDAGDALANALYHTAACTRPSARRLTRGRRGAPAAGRARGARPRAAATAHARTHARGVRQRTGRARYLRGPGWRETGPRGRCRPGCTRPCGTERTRSASPAPPPPLAGPPAHGVAGRGEQVTDGCREETGRGRGHRKRVGWVRAWICSTTSFSFGAYATAALHVMTPAPHIRPSLHRLLAYTRACIGRNVRAPSPVPRSNQPSLMMTLRRDVHPVSHHGNTCQHQSISGF